MQMISGTIGLVTFDVAASSWSLARKSPSESSLIDSVKDLGSGEIMSEILSLPGL